MFCLISAILMKVSLLRIFENVISRIRSSILRQSRGSSYPIMKADLVKAASEVIPSQHILVNMVSRRVRQLCSGYRPLVQVPPGMDAADIALTEIINEKLTFESTFSKDATNAPIVQFPGIVVAEDRGTIYCRSPVTPKKRGAAFTVPCCAR